KVVPPRILRGFFKVVRLAACLDPDTRVVEFQVPLSIGGREQGDGVSVCGDPGGIEPVSANHVHGRWLGVYLRVRATHGGVPVRLHDRLGGGGLDGPADLPSSRYVRMYDASGEV